MRCAFYGEEYLSKDDVIDILGIEFPICKSCARYYGLHSPKELLDVLEHSDYCLKVLPICIWHTARNAVRLNSF